MEKGTRSKNKLASKSSQKPIAREFSAGGVVFKKGKDKTRWLIIKPAGTNRWQLPKGLIDEGETSKETALREVQEEGGVLVKPLEKIGNIKYFFFFEGKRVFKTVSFYLMRYERDTKEGPDEEVDKATFLPFGKAHSFLTFKNDKEMLKKAKEVLDAGVQESLV